MGVNDNQSLYIDSDGIATTPSDMYYPAAALHGTRDIQFIPDGEYTRRKGDSLLKGTLRNPVANIQDGYILFDPLKSIYIQFTYLKLPPEPVYGYTQATGYAKYDEATSTQLLWDEPSQVEILYILASDLGIKIGKPEVVELAEKIKSEI